MDRTSFCSSVCSVMEVRFCGKRAEKVYLEVALLVATEKMTIVYRGSFFMRNIIKASSDSLCSAHRGFYSLRASRFGATWNGGDCPSQYTTFVLGDIPRVFLNGFLRGC
jgi:hypothetical protein